MVICLERGADLHMAQLMPLPLTASCFSKIQIGFAFLVLAHLGSPGQTAVKRVCVCVCDRDHRVLIVGGPNTRPTNPTWRTAAILKTVKSPYLCNRLTDFDESGRKTHSGSTVKISNFRKSKMAAVAILKITKITLSPQG